MTKTNFKKIASKKELQALRAQGLKKLAKARIKAVFVRLKDK